MPDAFRIQYTGAQTTAVMWKESNILYLTIGSTTTSYNLSNSNYDTLAELVTALDSVTDIDCSAIASGVSSVLLNDISQSHKADIKTSIYYAGYDNYTSPKKITELLDIDATEVKNTWLDEADAEIEEKTGFVFRSTLLSSQDVNIKASDIYTCNDFEWAHYLSSNACFFREYTPITALSALSINGINVTPTYVILDHDRMILTSGAETTMWVPGRAKVTVTLTYGYDAASPEGQMASEYCTYYVALKYLATESRAQTKGGAVDTIHHASVVLETDKSQSEEALMRKEWTEKMAYLVSKLQKTRYVVV